MADQILAIGGFDSNNVVFNDVESRPLAGGGRWHDVAPMSTRRTNLAAATLAGRVYAIGGFDEKDRLLANVEIYNPKRNKWTPGPALPRRRGDASAAVLNNRLYVAGGVVNSSTITESMLFLDQNNEWQPTAPMETARAQLRLVATEHHLYAIGGRADGPAMTNVERYDPDSDTWRTLRPLTEARAGSGVVAARIRNRRVLVAVGGAVFNAVGEPIGGLRTTEVFDIEDETWTTLDVLLPERRGSFGCVVDKAGAVLAISGGTRSDDGVGTIIPDVDALTLR